MALSLMGIQLQRSFFVIVENMIIHGIELDKGAATSAANNCMQKVVILVDVQNVYYTTKQVFKSNFDYNKFWSVATNNRHVVKAIAYAIDRGDKKQSEFQNILRAIGFEVKLKPYIQRSDGSAKGDWDVGIAIDAMEYSEDADIVVLVSGDGDFDLLADRLRINRGKFVEVYGVEKLTAASLINAANRFVPIEKELLLN